MNPEKTDSLSDITITLYESERQLVLLALAEMGLSRPGLNMSVRLIATKLHGLEKFERFKVTNADRVKSTHGPLLPPLNSTDKPEEPREFDTNALVGIVINGWPVVVPAGDISYDALMELCGIHPDAGYTVTYYRKHPLPVDNEGSLCRGQRVRVTPGMIVNYAYTGNA